MHRNYCTEHNATWREMPYSIVKDFEIMLTPKTTFINRMNQKLRQSGEQNYVFKGKRKQEEIMEDFHILADGCK